MLHSVCQQIWEIQQWPQDWQRSVLISVPMKGSTKECSNSRTIVLIFHAIKVMLKILQVRLQQYMNWELFSLDFDKVEEPEIKLPTLIEKAREFQKNIYLCFTVCSKAFDYVDHNKLWKVLKEMGIPDYLTCLLGNLRERNNRGWDGWMGLPIQWTWTWAQFETWLGTGRPVVL